MFRNLLKKAVLALALLGVIGGAAYALNINQNYIVPYRQMPGQVVNYYRVTINFNDPNISTGQLFGGLPNNAYILAIDVDVTTSFNAAAHNYVTLGVTSANANELVDASTSNGTISTTGGAISTGVYHLTAAVGLGIAVTGNSTYQTTNGVPLYAKYVQTSTAATTGSATFVIAYVPNNNL